MRRLMFALSVLGACLFTGTQASAQQACVMSPEGEVVCGPLVQPGYGPPPREYREPPPVFYDNRERDFRDRRWDNERRGGGPPTKCQPGYTVQGGECSPYRGPQKCQKGYTVQDGVCKPYSGR